VGECFFLVPAYPGCPGSKAVKRLCVCVSIYYDLYHPLCSVCPVMGVELRRGAARACRRFTSCSGRDGR